MVEIELPRQKALVGLEGNGGRGGKEGGGKSTTFYQTVNHASLLRGGEINNV